ncbi:MAG TPA: ABC transporter substrate-binding protein [Candidatus Limnocylindrales bacterium]
MHPSRSAFRGLALAAALAIVAASCTTGSASTAPTAVATPVPSNLILVPTPSASVTPSASPPTAPVALTVGLGYIPSVQFAQFYLADQAGYYRDAGLTVDLQNGRDADLVTLIGQGAIDIGNSDGTSVIPAVSQGIPIVYAATIYGQFPSIVLAKADSGIKTAADLKGKKIGTPGKYGSSWIMLQALLGSANLTTNDVTIVEYPDYGQATALQQGAVDAATGFANNEPIQLRKAGIEPVVLTVDAIVPLPGPGLVTGTTTLSAKHDALAAFTAATIHAMNDIAADPQKGLDATFKAVPDLAQDPDLQKQILDATIATWKNTRTNSPYGVIDYDGWKASLEYMTTLGLVPNPVTVDQLVTNSLLP